MLRVSDLAANFPAHKVSLQRQRPFLALKQWIHKIIAVIVKRSNGDLSWLSSLVDRYYKTTLLQEIIALHKLRRVEA